MDLNLAILFGRLAAPVDVETFSSGTRLLRCLLTVTSERPRHRTDVIPVTMWSPPDEICDGPWQLGERLYVAGAVQRRFWANDPERRARIEVIAHQLVRDRRDLDVAQLVGEPVKNSVIFAELAALKAT